MARRAKSSNGSSNGSEAPRKRGRPRKNGAETAPQESHLDDAFEDAYDEPATIEFAAETVTGDLRDFILDRLRHEQEKRPWHLRSESAQRDTVHEVEAAVGDAVRRVVELIASGGRPAIKAKLESVTVKDGIKAVLVLSRFDEQRHGLVDATGSAVLIVVADSAEFTGERAPAGIRPDQASLLGDVAVVHSTPDSASSPFA
jgi:hypothetical protein